MIFACVKENLINGLNIVAHISGKNISLPILNNILIEATDDGIVLSATNLEIGIKAKIRGKITTKGKIAVPAKLITSFINYLPEEKIEFELENNELKIVSGKWQTKIKTQNTDEYPLIPRIDEKDVIIIKNNVLTSLLNQTIFAATLNESRPELSGGKLIINENKVILAATDSYRLAEKKVEVIKENRKKNSVLIPIKTLQELLRILITEIKEDEVKIFWEENQITFSSSWWELTSRLINGEYPDYQQIIPEKWTTKIIADKNEIIKAVKATSLFTKSGIYDVIFEFKNKQEMIIKAANSQLGENEARINCQIEGENNMVVFNYHYILEGLANFSNSEIILEMTNANNPVVIKQKNDPDYLYLVMPIRQ
ncbi:MAG TPA: DNA polymerase III subunit beta [bacterium]|nr:DNA polymerase III subunit beta [bacterium]HPL95706.1 DNA polymerase III subunit beta [bacterium]